MTNSSCESEGHLSWLVEADRTKQLMMKTRTSTLNEHILIVDVEALLDLHISNSMLLSQCCLSYKYSLKVQCT